MKAVVQRVSQARVVVEGRVVGEIPARADKRDCGLMVLLGVENGDTEADGQYLAGKIVEFRIMADEEGKMNKSLIEVGGTMLVVSQFTLIADWRKGRRPGFTKAAPPAEGERLYLKFVEEVKKLGVPVETGEFGAHMQVDFINDGPVTLVVENQFARQKELEAAK